MDTKAVRNIVTATALSYGVLLIILLISGIFLPSMADPDEAIKLIGSALFLPDLPRQSSILLFCLLFFRARSIFW